MDWEFSEKHSQMAVMMLKMVQLISPHNVRPQVSLTVPNPDHFVPVSLMFFWMQLPKLKN